MKKIAFSGFMASMLMVTGAAFAAGETNTASLTTKGYVDAGLKAVYKAVDDVKADKTTVTALTSTVADKADASSVYTKTEIDEAGFLTSADISGKADADSVYTKTEIDEAGFLTSADISGKADTATVTALTSTVAGKADADSVYTKTEIDNAGFLTSADVAVYTGTGGIVVDANHQIALDTTGLDSTAMYVFKDGTWEELDINGTFPTNFNFAGE